jgi:hypothetical protein
MTIEMNRRQAIAFGMASAAALSFPGAARGDAAAPLVRGHDERLKNTLAQQNTDAASTHAWGQAQANPRQTGMRGADFSRLYLTLSVTHLRAASRGKGGANPPPRAVLPDESA